MRTHAFTGQNTQQVGECLQNGVVKVHNSNGSIIQRVVIWILAVIFRYSQPSIEDVLHLDFAHHKTN